ncbi:hypothetical protein ACFQ07_33015 [Actinomadura adrarensis]|uniref:Uncharacterized protein n=1 Tax=Actinomadura adrarensis TaxID=1819600 RepID=A0ABW3CR93_9ACTN
MVIVLLQHFGGSIVFNIMAPAVPASVEPDDKAEAVGDPAVRALTRIVREYAPSQASTFRRDHWTGLQPDPYSLRRESDALADRGALELEQAAVNLANEAIALSSMLRAAVITRGNALRSVGWGMGVSWIMNARPTSPTLTVYTTACRLLTRASAVDRYLLNRRQRGSRQAAQRPGSALTPLAGGRTRPAPLHGAGPASA